MSEAKRERQVTWSSRLAFFILRLLGPTWRMKFVNQEVLNAERAKGPVIIPLWHGQMLPVVWSMRNRGIVVMVSEHSDGEIIARVLTAFGFRTMRGSTSRGAARVLLEAARQVSAGNDVIITPDGPRGPYHSVAPGVMAIAQRTGAAIVPIGAAASSAWELKTWDRFFIPKPFARLNMAFGPVIRVDSDSARKAHESSGTVHDSLERAIATAREALA